MSVNNFSVLHKLGEQNVKSFKGFFGDNITNVRIGKDGWGRVEVAIDNDTARKIIDNAPMIFMVLVADKADFDRVKAELESEEA